MGQCGWSGENTPLARAAGYAQQHGPPPLPPYAEGNLKNWMEHELIRELIKTDEVTISDPETVEEKFTEYFSSIALKLDSNL